jgi:hypothetical protein
MQQVTNPYPGFVGLDGKPLALGKIYIGVENEDPETNPVTVYFDDGASQTATQPIRTLAGYPDQNGSPAQLWVTGRYSIRIRDVLDQQVFYVASAGDDGRPYHIHVEFLGDAPAAQQVISKHVFGVAVSLPANFAASVYAHVGTAPTGACDFALHANGVSFGTLTISTLGVVSVSCTAQDFAAGDRLEIVTPDAGTDLADIAIVIIGALS